MCIMRVRPSPHHTNHNSYIYMMYECKTSHNGEEKTFILQADSFAMAEQSFLQIAKPGHELISIHKVDTGIDNTDTGNTSSHDIKPKHNRIGFNVDALQRQIE